MEKPRTSSNEGKAGYSSLGRPKTLKKLGPLRMEVTFLPSDSSWISSEGSSRMMERRRLAGRVVEPVFSTVAAVSVRTLTSRSVAVSRRPVSVVSRRTLERTGRVTLLETMFCMRCRPSRSACLVTVNFMDNGLGDGMPPEVSLDRFSEGLVSKRFSRKSGRNHYRWSCWSRRRTRCRVFGSSAMFFLTSLQAWMTVP